MQQTQQTVDTPMEVVPNTLVREVDPVTNTASFVVTPTLFDTLVARYAHRQAHLRPEGQSGAPLPEAEEGDFVDAVVIDSGASVAMQIVAEDEDEYADLPPLVELPPPLVEAPYESPSPVESRATPVPVRDEPDVIIEIPRPRCSHCPPQRHRHGPCQLELLESSASASLPAKYAFTLMRTQVEYHGFRTLRRGRLLSARTPAAFVVELFKMARSVLDAPPGAMAEGQVVFDYAKDADTLATVMAPLCDCPQVGEAMSKAHAALRVKADDARERMRNGRYFDAATQCLAKNYKVGRERMTGRLAEEMVEMLKDVQMEGMSMTVEDWYGELRVRASKASRYS